jgi:hypothetical protein
MSCSVIRYTRACGLTLGTSLAAAQLSSNSHSRQTWSLGIVSLGMQGLSMGIRCVSGSGGSSTATGRSERWPACGVYLQESNQVRQGQNTSTMLSSSCKSKSSLCATQHAVPHHKHVPTHSPPLCTSSTTCMPFTLQHPRSCWQMPRHSCRQAKSFAASHAQQHSPDVVHCAVEGIMAAGVLRLRAWAEKQHGCRGQRSSSCQQHSQHVS